MFKKIIIASVLFMAIPTLSFSEEIKITVKGMVCSFCAQGIKKTFGKMDNIKNINVDLDKKIVTIEIDDLKPLSDEEIKNIITDSGYDVFTIERGKNG
ncbi:MAG: cation transporter [bacterium]|nr:cation transporter [bacterium]